METSAGEFYEPGPEMPLMLTERERTLLDAVRTFEWGTDTARLADTLDLAPETLETELANLAAKQCLVSMPHEDGRPTSWYLRITNPVELERLKEENNPDSKPVGHFTGRCKGCESDKLWDDMITYGCKCCGATYNAGDIPVRKVENGTGRDLGPAW